MNSNQVARNRVLARVDEVEAAVSKKERELESIVAEHEREISALREEGETFRRVYDYAWEPTKDVSGVSPGAEGVDLNGALTHRERLARIALATEDRTVNATEAAHVLLRAGVTQSKKSNLVPSLFRLMDNSDDWVKGAPGSFVYQGEPT